VTPPLLPIQPLQPLAGPVNPIVGLRNAEDVPYNPPPGVFDRLARDIFDPRQTRSRGPVEDYPRVQPRILERKQ